MTAAGIAEPQARAQLRLGVAVTRGLLLDLLATGDATGDAEGADQAMEAYTALTERCLAAGGADPGQALSDSPAAGGAAQ